MHQPQPPKASGSSRGFAVPKIVWPALTLVALLAFNAIFTDGFMHVSVRDGRVYGSLIDIAKNAAPAALAGLGMTLVIATGGVDLSVGAVMAIAGTVAAIRITQHHDGLPLVLLFSLAVSLMCGLWNGLLVSIFRIQPIVATLLLMVAGRGVAQLLAGGVNISVPSGPFDYIGSGTLFHLPFQVPLTILALLATIALMRATALGLFVESVGDNETASRFAGLNDRFVKWAVYAFSGLCAGIGGLIITSNTHTADANNVGLNLELDAILAVVIGGTALTGGRFYLLGTIIGALIIQTLTTTILTNGYGVQYTLVIKALVVLGVCLIQAPVIQKKVVGLFRRSA